MGLFSKLSKNKQEAAGQDSGYYSKADDQAVLERARSKRAAGADGPAARRSRSGDDPALPEKKRARRRLVGAVALALGVAIGLPMLLDSEPKPLASDIAIQIPSKDKTADAAAHPPADVAALDQNEEIIDAPAPLKPAAAPAQAAATPAKTPAATPAVTAAATSTATPATTPAATPAANPATTPGAGPAVTAPAAKPAAALAATPAAMTATPAVKPMHVEPPAAPLKDPVKEAAAKAAADKLALETRLAKEHKAQELKDAKDRADKAEAKARAEHEQKLADAKADAKAEAKVAKARLEQEQKLAKAKADEAKPAKPEDGARAMAILEDKPSDTRFVVQVAAVASQEKVDELQAKLREAGIKSYTQKVHTAGGGALTRIRVGPFSSKDEAEKVRAKLGKIGLSSSLATS